MKLLIIGELKGQLTEAILIAKRNGADVHHVVTIDDAMEQLRKGQAIELVMIDVTYAVAELVQKIKQERMHIPVIGCGLNDNAQDAVNAIKAGAKEYIPLPPDEELIAAVLAAITEDNSHFICESKAMQELMQMASQVASSEANILITGESGTGKEMVARYIHQHSQRHAMPFVSVNCAAIPENLIESELFGHEKGAFTGAAARRIGKFEESSNGTLLLDEISEMAIQLQAKLLRAIQEKEIDRVGGNQPIPINLRVLATSNRQLSEEVKAGNFREDLLFRLNIIHLQIPPLRERKEDILPFAQHFVKKYAEVNGVSVKSLSKETQQKLLSYRWPGNVRELENTMHRALLLSATDSIEPASLQFVQQESEENQNNQDSNSLVGRTVDEVERDLILDTMDHCLGNRTQAATILGISIRTLRNKLNSYEEVS